MLSCAYDKTEKGREEIATRKHQLANRLRTLLVMIDGKKSAADLLKKLAAIGLDENSIQELIDLEMIAPTLELEPEPASAPASESDESDVAVKEENQPPIAQSDNVSTEETEAEQFQAIYNFFNDTIKSALGFRGFTLQLKVERAKSIDDFKNLRHAYLEAILKVKGREMARSLRDRLDLLLHESEKIKRDSLSTDTIFDYK
ncbi:hypothetical protein H8K32_08995 [Undibacterium jejuense]|uniref:Uncharacterized protein n=2 Tax=Undibacterium jejuense TaxID=1344949 RepID=A0A923KKS3_9BURK|nr:hypothetical protein [Undibacterium jejuense]